LESKDRELLRMEQDYLERLGQARLEQDKCEEQIRLKDQVIGEQRSKLADSHRKIDELNLQLVKV